MMLHFILFELQDERKLDYKYQSNVVHTSCILQSGFIMLAHA
jgi:hypothetical protein